MLVERCLYNFVNVWRGQILPWLCLQSKDETKLVPTKRAMRSANKARHSGLWF
jgi:hypothetical protein